MVRQALALEPRRLKNIERVFDARARAELASKVKDHKTFSKIKVNWQKQLASPSQKPVISKKQIAEALTEDQDGHIFDKLKLEQITNFIYNFAAIFAISVNNELSKLYFSLSRESQKFANGYQKYRQTISQYILEASILLADFFKEHKDKSLQDDSSRIQALLISDDASNTPLTEPERNQFESITKYIDTIIDITPTEPQLKEDLVKAITQLAKERNTSLHRIKVVAKFTTTWTRFTESFNETFANQDQLI